MLVPGSPDCTGSSDILAVALNLLAMAEGWHGSGGGGGGAEGRGWSREREREKGPRCFSCDFVHVRCLLVLMLAWMVLDCWI